jgi:hypothetical protein
VFLGELALLVVLALTSSHLGGEDTRSDGIDTDLETTALDLGRQHLVQVNDSSLGGVVVEVTLRDTNKTGDGRDVDDGAGPAVCALSSLLEERQESSAEEERCDDVCGVEVAPVLETVAVISYGISEVSRRELTCPGRRGSSSSPQHSCHRESAYQRRCRHLLVVSFALSEELHSDILLKRMSRKPSLVSISLTSFSISLFLVISATTGMISPEMFLP